MGEMLNANGSQKRLTLGKVASIATLIMLIIAILTYFEKGSEIGNEKVLADEIYNVNSERQSGGITAGKIENVTIITDKESLGIREPNGLYQNGVKFGTVRNFKADEPAKTFTIAEIEFDNSLKDMEKIWQPYEYQKYIIHIRRIEHLVTMMPPGAKGISGNILSQTN